MPQTKTEADLHRIATTLADILKELKRFNKNYEQAHAPITSITYYPRYYADTRKEDADGESGSDD